MGNHNHDSRYLKLTGGIATGAFVLTGSSRITITQQDGDLNLEAFGDGSINIKSGGDGTHAITLSTASISADRVVAFPNKNGTLALVSDLPQIQIVDLTALL